MLKTVYLWIVVQCLLNAQLSLFPPGIKTARSSTRTWILPHSSNFILLDFKKASSEQTGNDSVYFIISQIKTITRTILICRIFLMHETLINTILAIQMLNYT